MCAHIVFSACSYYNMIAECTIAPSMQIVCKYCWSNRILFWFSHSILGSLDGLLTKLYPAPDATVFYDLEEWSVEYAG